MKYSILTKTFIIGLMLIATLGCKKSVDDDSQTASLKGTTWLLIQENLFYPNGDHNSHTLYSAWTFSDDHTFRILNPLSFIQEERGTWSAEPGKISISIRNDDSFHYDRNLQIKLQGDKYMTVLVEGLVYETAGLGKTSSVEYELVKI